MKNWVKIRVAMIIDREPVHRSLKIIAMEMNSLWWNLISRQQFRNQTRFLEHYKLKLTRNLSKSLHILEYFLFKVKNEL